MRHTDPADPPARAAGDDLPRHPKWPTVWLLLGTTALIVLLAVASSLGWL